MVIGNLLEEMKIKMQTFNMSPHNHEEFLLMTYDRAKEEDERDFIQWEQNLERGNPVTGRPRPWKQQFTEIVRQFVQGQIPLFKKNDAENNVMEHVSNVQQVVLEALLSFSNKNEVFEIFAKTYHACIFQHLEKIFQAELDIKSLSFFLFWATHTYKSEEFMGHIDIRDITLKASVLDPILEVNWIYKASEKFINAVQSQINVRLTRRLKMENVPWPQLPVDIKQIMLDSIEDGQLVSETIRGRIQNFCAVQLLGILESFLELIERSKDMPCSKGLEVILSCVSFRGLVTTIVDNNTEDMRKCLAELTEVETKICDQLLEKLLCNVKIHLRDNLKDGRRSSLNHMEEVSSLIKSYFSNITEMNRATRKILVDRAYYKIVQEYITVLIRSSLRCTSERRYQIPEKIIQDSKELQHIFSEQQSSVICLNKAIQDVAEILKINDIEALKVEVAAFVRNYSGVRKEHISAILDIKGKISKGDRRCIFKQMDDICPNDNHGNKLFQGIKVSKWRWRKNDCCLLCCRV
ncbi:exocyst complex component 3-like protein 2 [Scyliorhinus canicula]|uniref:exocyst complex component 3-like protein 2 n=1 Tax=Scyliorhinus canicula TaxID=7830 RepID=UPI0018F57331|nr:exocyst complex component 3-like protein 2 [Scyliorhinus canicula]